MPEPSASSVETSVMCVSSRLGLTQKLIAEIIVREVLRVSAKSESSFVYFGALDEGTRQMMLGCSSKAAHHGVGRNVAFESTSADGLDRYIEGIEAVLFRLE